MGVNVFSDLTVHPQLIASDLQPVFGFVNVQNRFTHDFIVANIVQADDILKNVVFGIFNDF